MIQTKLKYNGEVINHKETKANDLNIARGISKSFTMFLNNFENKLTKKPTSFSLQGLLSQKEHHIWDGNLNFKL